MVQSIDQLKSLVSAKDGVARPNLFRIKFPSLPGASSDEINIVNHDYKNDKVVSNKISISKENIIKL